MSSLLYSKEGERSALQMSKRALVLPSDRAHNTCELIWDELDTLARAEKPLDLSIGCPDFFPPRKLRQDLLEVVEGPDIRVHQYTRGFGHPRLCSALASLYAPLLQRPSLDPLQEVVITNGASEALFVTIMGLVNPGDEVIVIDPAFDCYESQVVMAGGKPVFVPLRTPTDRKATCSADWALDEGELRAAFTAKTKAILLNTPHNPTGKVFNRTELSLIAGLARQHGACVISDEVYEWLTYDEEEHVRIATLPGMWERTITIGSAGKTFSVTGWKIGWMIGTTGLLAGPKVVHQNCGYICITPIQEALARSFERETALLQSRSPDCYFLSLRAEANGKRDKLVALLSEAGLDPVVPQGGYFVLADVRNLIDKLGVGGDPKEPKDLRFVKWLSKNRKLQGIPSSVFFSTDYKHEGENYVRFCLLKENSTIEKAGEVLLKLKEELKSQE